MRWIRRIISSLPQGLWWALTVRASKPKQLEGRGVRTYASFLQIAQVLGGARKWRQDGLIDKMSHPALIQDRIDRDELIGDCEDYAIYWATALLKSRLASRCWLLSCQYRRDPSSPLTKYGGHVVCVYESARTDKLYWVDYKLPHDITSPEQAAHTIGSTLYGRELISAALTRVYLGRGGDDTPRFRSTKRIF